MFKVVGTDDVMEVSGDTVSECLRETADLIDTGVIEWVSGLNLHYEIDDGGIPERVFVYVTGDIDRVLEKLNNTEEFRAN